MSHAKPLVIAFSQSQLDGPVRDRINAVQSAQLYLAREGLNPLPDLGRFLNPSFYVVADTKRALFHGGEAQVSLGRKGLQEFGYVVSGQIVTLPLTEDQQDFVEDLGFTVKHPVNQPAAVFA